MTPARELPGWVAQALALSFAAGCATTLPPNLSAQTAEVLPQGELALAGGGSATLLTDLHSVGGCCTGGELRVRTGVGGDQELSFDSGLVASGGAYGISGGASWKRQLASWAALGAGLDVLIHDGPGQTVVAPGGEVAAFFSTPARGRLRRAQLYCGASLVTYVPALRDPLLGPGVILEARVPAGVALRTSEWTRLFFETGLVTSATWYRATPVVESFGLGGLYGALAFEVLFL